MPKAREDKEWAKRYILDPLTAPEPSQLDGPGSSFFNPRRSLSLTYKPKEVPPSILQRRHSGYPTPPDSASPTRATFQIHHPKPISPGRRHSYLPPTDWAPAEVVLRRSQSLNPSSQRPVHIGRSQSLAPATQLPNFETSAIEKLQIKRKPLNTLNTQPKATKPAAVPAAQPSRPTPAAPSTLPPPPPKPLRKAVSSPRPNKLLKVGRKPPQTHHTQGTAEILGEILADKTSSYINRLSFVSSAASAPAPAPLRPANTATPPPLRRTGSFVKKPSGEMAYQSPDMSKPPVAPPVARPAAAPPAVAPPAATAEPSERRSSTRKHRSSRRSRPYTDTIDSLDQVGGVYHHGGPYDATLAAVNINKKKSPLEAVRDSNAEAIKATPREYIQDSLTKHVPLQGTSTVPPGMPDRNGNVLHYQEGADLMREPDAKGGAYRRYEFVPYHPDDLKGKGEPSYSIEKALKENNGGKLRKHSASLSHGATAAYEMQDQRGSNRASSYRPTSSRAGSSRGASGSNAPLLPPKDGKYVSARRQSFSHGSTSGAPPLAATTDRDRGRDRQDPNNDREAKGGSGLARSNSASQRFTDGIKRRFGSLRRK